MIHRESSMAKESPNKPRNQPSWPPKSPRDALLTSPSGRKRLQQRFNDRTSPSPSPLKQQRSATKPSYQAQGSSDVEDNDNEEEEDEETLQLKLQAIEAKLKLKRLQKGKSKDSGDPGGGEGDNQRAAGRVSRPISGLGRNERRPQSISDDVQVPVSPTKPARQEQDQSSPKRVLLGIDKGWKASDVSLKRASSLTSRLRAARSTPSGTTSDSRQRNRAFTTDNPKPKSFSERLAESRTQDREKEEKEERRSKIRSKGFGIDAQELQSYRSRDTPGAAPRPPSSSRDSASMQPPPPRPSSFLRRDSKDSQQNHSRTGSSSRSFELPTRVSPTKTQKQPASQSFDSAFSVSTDHPTSSDTSLFDTFTGLHLSKRLTPHNMLTRSFSDKTIYTIPQILKEVKSPDYDPPDIDNDFIILGVIASKSTPLNHKRQHPSTTTADPDSAGEDDQAAGRAKFMVLRLTDLKWELDCFLFGTGFSQFWKLPLGTVVAILNPGIMPPRNKDSGNFSLKLSSSEDTVLEIGSARDLDFCKALRKDGKECGAWVDKRRTEVCEFHISLAVDKTKRGRMEIATMSGLGKGPSNKDSKEKKPWGHQKYKHSEGWHPGAPSHEHVYMVPGSGRNAADLLDDEDGLFANGENREERDRKRRAAKEKERDLARKLGNIGNGTGAEYLRVQSGMKTESQQREETARSNSRFGGGRSESSQSTDMDPRKGLFNRRAEDIDLGPNPNAIKRKRIGHTSTSSMGSAEPMGWSGAFKRNMLSDREPSAAAKKQPQGPVEEGTGMEKFMHHDLSTSTSSRQGRRPTSNGRPPSSTTTTTNERPSSMTHHSPHKRDLSSREASPTKKKARLFLEGKGIREPGRDSLPGMMITLDDDDDDDGLEII